MRCFDPRVDLILARSAPAGQEGFDVVRSRVEPLPELRDALTIAADRLHRRRLLKVSAMEHL
jgi:hypothetical protein